MEKGNKKIMVDSFKPGIYKHYSGKLYHFLEVCRHSETLELMVVYRQLYGTHGVWVRPLEMIYEKVVVEGVSIPRFAFLHPCSVTEPH